MSGWSPAPGEWVLTPSSICKRVLFVARGVVVCDGWRTPGSPVVVPGLSANRIADVKPCLPDREEPNE